jgi:hypothetical protein
MVQYMYMYVCNMRYIAYICRMAAVILITALVH